MATKVISAKPTDSGARVRRRIVRKTTDDRILDLKKKLGIPLGPIGSRLNSWDNLVLATNLLC